MHAEHRHDGIARRMEQTCLMIQKGFEWTWTHMIMNQVRMKKPNIMGPSTAVPKYHD